jgi:hypothetical protein
MADSGADSAQRTDLCDIGNILLLEVAFDAVGVFLDAAQGADCRTRQGDFRSCRSRFRHTLFQIGVE